MGMVVVKLGPNSEARKTDRGRVLRERMFPSPLVRGQGEHCKPPQWGLGQSPSDLAI